MTYVSLTRFDVISLFKKYISTISFFMVMDMKLVTLIVGEFVLLFASVLVFRSAWLLLDEYLGNSNLWLLLGIGVVTTVIGLVIVNYEVKCELRKNK